jgi:hypothetical protein
VAQILPAKVPEKSSAKVIATFKDVEDDSAIVPLTVTWTLSDLDGTIINGRQDVVASAASTVEIFLSGDDLQIVDQTNKLEQRRLLISATYNNGVSTLPLKDEAIFAVYNLGNVT